jgi:hypothetical protein
MNASPACLTSCKWAPRQLNAITWRRQDTIYFCQKLQQQRMLKTLPVLSNHPSVTVWLTSMGQWSCLNICFYVSMSSERE